MILSKYTTELRYICEVLSGKDSSKGYNDVDSIVTLAAPIIFNVQFPIHNEEHRLDLEKMILRHYYTREIAAETFGLWQLWLNNTMCEIMPKYNELYRVAELAKNLNPLNNDTVTESRETVRHDEGTNDNTRKDSDTPRGELNGIESNKYLSFAQVIGATVENDGTETVNYTKTARHGDIIDTMEKYKTNVYNIDLMIIDELKPLFMGLW